MDGNALANICLKISISVLCVVGSVCIYKITNKIIGTLETVNNTTLPAVSTLVNKCSSDGVSLNIGLDEDVEIAKQNGGWSISLVNNKK